MTHTSQRWAFDATLGFVAALLTLLTIGIISYRNTQKLAGAVTLVSHRHRVLEQIQVLQISIAESEKAEALFGTTRDPNILINNKSSLDRVDLAFSQLRTLTSSNRDEQRRIFLLGQTLNQKGKVWLQTSRDENHDRSRSLFAAETLQRESAAIGDQLDEMMKDENRLLQADLQESQAHGGRALDTLVLLTGFMILFLTLAYRAVLKDIQHRRQVEATLKELTRQDTLTGLANRRAFYEALENERARITRYKHPLTLAYIDLDDFKRVNDLYGHSMGDVVLTKIAAIIRENLRKTDVVARIGGDEFAVLLPETDATTAEYILRKVQRILNEQIDFGAGKVSLSIGGVTHLGAHQSVDEMVRQADELMYTVKAAGKNGLSIAVLG